MSNHKQPLEGPSPEKIRSMFDQISNAYDKANNVLSLGIHHLWRKKLVRWSEAKEGQHILDCATGTGDLAIEFKKVVGSTGKVIGTDFSPGMLSHAPQKAKSKKLDIEFSLEDVTKLSFKDNVFDVSSISFGIRNVQKPFEAICELSRVVKPKGYVMILEFGQPQRPVIGPAYTFYSEKILPKLGGLISGKQDAYSYLQESSKKFPCGKNFAELMMSTGKFSSVEFTELSFGIAYIYKAQNL